MESINIKKSELERVLFEVLEQHPFLQGFYLYVNLKGDLDLRHNSYNNSDYYKILDPQVLELTESLSTEEIESLHFEKDAKLIGWLVNEVKGLLPEFIDVYTIYNSEVTVKINLIK